MTAMMAAFATDVTVMEGEGGMRNEKIIDQYPGQLYGLSADDGLAPLSQWAYFPGFWGWNTVGIDGVFLNMASMLGIVEMGLGVSIVYKLYRPIADGDMEAVAVILKFLRKAYRVIALVVMIIGAVLSLFAGFLVNEGEYSKPWLSAIFLLYVLVY